MRLVKYSAAVALLLVAIAAALRWLPGTDPQTANLAIAERVLRAVAKGDYDAFVAQADKSVRRIRIDHFQSLTERHAPRLRTGHELRLLDERWRGAVHVCRWKLVFADGGRHAVLTLGVREGKVATFAIF